MLTELEPRKFRRGENPNKPFGGHIADAPFPKALRALAVSNGFESKSDLARHLGNKNHGVVSRWYKGERVPSPESFGELLILLESNDDESEKMTERLVDSWAKLFTEGKGLHGSRPGSYRHLRKTSETPLGQWIEGFCKDEKITIGEFLKNSKVGVNPADRDEFGDRNFSLILKNAPVAYGLSEEKKEGLSEAIVQTIKQKKESGHRFNNYENGKEVRTTQERLGYIAYNCKQAGEKLGVSRETVRLKLKKFNLSSLLITEENLEFLRREFDKTKAVREKMQETLNRKKLLLKQQQKPS